MKHSSFVPLARSRPRQYGIAVRTVLTDPWPLFSCNGVSVSVTPYSPSLLARSPFPFPLDPGFPLGWVDCPFRYKISQTSTSESITYEYIRDISNRNSVLQSQTIMISVFLKLPSSKCHLRGLVRTR